MDPDHCVGHHRRDHHHFAVLDVIVLSACIAAYGLNQLLLKRTGGIFLSGHFNDIVAAVALLAFADGLVAVSPYGVAVFRRALPAFTLIVVAAIYWELITPVFKESTAD